MTLLIGGFAGGATQLMFEHIPQVNVLPIRVVYQIIIAGESRDVDVGGADS